MPWLNVSACLNVFACHQVVLMIMMHVSMFPAWVGSELMKSRHCWCCHLLSELESFCFPCTHFLPHKKKSKSGSPASIMYLWVHMSKQDEQRGVPTNHSSAIWFFHGDLIFQENLASIERTIEVPCQEKCKGEEMYMRGVKCEKYLRI